MNNNTEVIFENIEERILKEIQDAHYAIFVSVAWFTNKRLFNALLEKAKDNCYVSIIIQLDEINSQSGIDYGQIQLGRSECLQISKDTELLHDKFCVIDFKKVITGSYNWTYKASYNSENILILNDPSVATQYISRFEQQKAKFNDCYVQRRANTQIKSSAIIEQPISTLQQKHTEPLHVPTIKQCPHCKKEIGYKNRYCEYCGKLQEGQSEISITITCLKCHKAQDSKLIDALNNNFCTYCGSKELIVGKDADYIKEHYPDDLPF